MSEQVPIPSTGTRMSYQKVRERKSVDFPLLSIGLAADLDGDDTIQSISLVVAGLGAKPKVVGGLDKIAAGRKLTSSGRPPPESDPLSAPASGSRCCHR